MSKFMIEIDLEMAMISNIIAANKEFIDSLQDLEKDFSDIYFKNAWQLYED